MALLEYGRAAKGEGMNFGEAISSGFSNYLNFSGQACRSEYWYWFLFVVLGQIATAIIDSVTGVQLTTAIFSLVVLLPGIAVSVRRLHDLDRSGWWLLLSFVPLVGTVILIVWFCTRGTPGPNRFGPDPLAGFGQISPRPVA